MKRTKKITGIMSAIEDNISKLQEIEDKQRSIYDGKSEKWQETEAAEKMYGYISAIEAAKDYLQNAFDELDAGTEAE